MRHKGEAQILDSDHRVGIRKLARRFVPEVLAGMGDVFVQPSDLKSGFAASVTAALAATETALGDAQLGLRLAQPARVLDFHPIGQREQGGNAHVDVHRLPGMNGGRGRVKLELRQTCHLRHERLRMMWLIVAPSGSGR